VSILKKFTGIIGNIFQLGLSGPKLKNNSGVIEARNNADNDYANFRSNNGTLDGDLSVAGGQYVGRTVVNVATYDVLVTDFVLDVTYTITDPVTSLTIPTAQVINGRKIIIKDKGYNSSVNNITVDTEGGALIEGDATLVIAGDGDSVTLICDGTDFGIY